VYAKITAAVIIASAAAQFVPVERTNPPVEAEVPAPDAVRAILRRSCYDCHSHESRWPWYAHVAPISWLIAHDVDEARDHLNFSTWNAYGKRKRVKNFEEIWEEVEKGEMPLWFYVSLHPDARLSEADKQAIHAWATGAH